MRILVKNIIIQEVSGAGSVNIGTSMNIVNRVGESSNDSSLPDITPVTPPTAPHPIPSHD